MGEPFTYRHIAASWGLIVHLTATARTGEPGAAESRRRLEYPPTDYQPEAAAVAVAAWAADRFGFEPLPVIGRFDKPAGR
ncbi:hypothetical protein [Streptomyces sp. SBT349]|uniref:hypothetical protein n=1 Tax=Streptomyces sp. SBT349 TaxID=1580539 RepID=UPI00066AED18|nr:hypothetical protein [Streptomyces sp. SBT349]